MKLKIIGDTDGPYLRVINAETGEEVEGVTDMELRYSAAGGWGSDGEPVYTAAIEISGVAVDIETIGRGT